MRPEIMKRDDDSVTICVTVPLNGPMLKAEEAIQDALNEVGLLVDRVRQLFDQRLTRF